MIAPHRFALPARVLHWLMAVLIVAMLFIGVGMVSTAGPAYPLLLAWHRPLGLAIVVLGVIRLVVRATHRPPALPGDLPAIQVFAAKASHYLLYAAMIAMPLIGWAMLSAAGSPVQMTHGIVLPPILPHNALLFGWLRVAHGVIGYLFFALILAHLGAALFHGLVRRDGVLGSMASFRLR